MTMVITKNQAALLLKRQAAFAKAQTEVADAERVARLEMAALAETVAALGADGGLSEDAEIERFSVESKGDAHTLTLVEKPKEATPLAG
jgi:hypothetical protein